MYFDKKIQNLLSIYLMGSYNYIFLLYEMNISVLALRRKTHKKEYLYEEVQKQDLTPELYADTLATIFTRERSKIH
ncbi:hypothetical protein HMPREF3237_00665 [Streptococcus sp. HMSC34B10]|jgi:hypothetical protein|nr:hypothetical protein HMPREF3237_00665 [Streptococcus sp. HMSC34B10]